MERRLAAILGADIVGYSRLVEAGDAGVITRQNVNRKELVELSVAKHRGRIVKLKGDGSCMEFGSDR